MGSESRGNYHPVIHNLAGEDIQQIRGNIQYIFGTEELPDTSLDTSGSSWIVRLENGFVFHIRQYLPDEPNHAGHEGHTMRDEYALNQFLEAGYEVWSLDMPFIGNNATSAVVNHPPLGEIPINNHEFVTILDEITTGSPVRYFLEPVVALVNAAEEHGYQNISTVGISGGGWTTTLAAAIDPRIDASFPVAGRVPWDYDLTTIETGVTGSNWSKNFTRLPLTKICISWAHSSIHTYRFFFMNMTCAASMNRAIFLTKGKYELS